ADFQPVLSELRAKLRVLVWHEDLEAAKAQAVNEKKDLFIYFTGSDWCSWCLLVRKDVFGKDAFSDYVPKHFVLVELDFPHHKAKPRNYAQNLELFHRWGLKGYPSLILADAQGRPYANLRDGKVRDDAAAYIERMEKLRQDRVARDTVLTQALALEGLDKAKVLDQALRPLPQDFKGEYRDAITQICTLDSLDQAGLRSKYLPLLVRKKRDDIQDAMKRQDWDGTILKIDQIITDLRLTGPLAADIWRERARAHAKLNQWDEAETDYAKAIEL